jgi:hypothetical protein
MKKAKIILTAITVFALVGGALAFKASKFGAKVYCTTSPNGSCSFTLFNYTTVDQGLGTIEDTYCSSIPTTDPCPTIDVYSLQ